MNNVLKALKIALIATMASILCIGCIMGICVLAFLYGDFIYYHITSCTPLFILVFCSPVLIVNFVIIFIKTLKENLND